MKGSDSSSSSKKVSISNDTEWPHLLSAFQIAFGKETAPTALSIQYTDGECEELNFKARSALDTIKGLPSKYPGSVIVVGLRSKEIENSIC